MRKMLTISKFSRSRSHAAFAVASAVTWFGTSQSLPFACAQTISTIANGKIDGGMAESGISRIQPRHGQDAPSAIASGDKVRFLARSYETAAISAEINARITRLPEREGDRFRKGDVIVEFDCRKIETEHRAAAAIFNAHQANYENQRQMQLYSAAGTLAVDQARFEMGKAQADVDGLEVKRLSCAVHAPFDGRVIEKLAQAHEIAQPNQPLIRIINEGKLELVLMVPSAWISRVTTASTFPVRIDETGETHEARILQSTGLIDPVSQSARYIAEFLTPVPSIRPGMSGTAMLSLREGSR
jgi:membrane fusion protein, multidrug efflux system